MRKIKRIKIVKMNLNSLIIVRIPNITKWFYQYWVINHECNKNYNHRSSLKYVIN